MIIPERPSLERRVLTALDGLGRRTRRIPVVLGGCGTGRTSLLLRLRDLIGRTSCQYIDVERVATTPGAVLLVDPRLLAAALAARSGGARRAGAREAFDATLAFLDTARAPGGAPATFLLDEFLELRTFESFPGLRTVLRDLIGALAASGNRFVLASRYPARALRLLREAPSAFEIIHVTPLTTAEIRATLPSPSMARAHRTRIREAEADRAHDELARLVQALSDGRPAYARLIADTSATLDPHGADPVSALSALLAPGRRARSPLPLLLRAPPASRARLRRAQGHPRASSRKRSRSR